MESSFTVLRVRGIPIGAHWSWLLVAGLVVWSLSQSLFPASYPGLSEAIYLAMGIVAGLLFFAAILAHELGHAFAALREGMEIDGITLWLFGGVARFRGMFASPGAEFRIAIAGPLVSVAIAVVFFLLGSIEGSSDVARAAEGVADYLARINAILVGFNLVPALPLDGGRVLRSWLWKRQGSFSAATVSAARAGKAFGVVLAVLGLLDFFTGGGGGGGLWLLFLGWFLVQAAQAEASGALVRQSLRGRRVRELMTSSVETVPPQLTVATFLEHIGTRRFSTYPVVRGDEPVGLVSLRRVEQVPAADRDRRRIEDVMQPLAELTIFSPDDEIVVALDSLGDESKRALVMEEGRLAGLMSLSDVARVLEREPPQKAQPAPSRRGGGLLWAVVAVTMLIAAGAIYRPPLVVFEPGTTLDVSDDITITGVPSQRPEGSYLLTSVRLAQPNVLGLAWAAASGKEVAPLSQLLPEGTDAGDYFRQQRQIFDQSRLAAAAAAARSAGFEVAVNGSGVIVVALIPQSPAAEVLEESDVIVAIDGRPVRSVADLQEPIRARPAGASFELEIERGELTRSFRVRSARLPGGTETITGIGVSITTRDFDVEFPFEIEFAERRIGGPSAGLAYALAIADMLEPGDFTEGREVGATGTIDLEGAVGSVGGLPAKAEALERAGADLFLVPEAEVAGVDETTLEIRGVASLEQAVESLTT